MRRRLSALLACALSAACASPATAKGPCAEASAMTAAKDAGIHAPLDRLVRAHVRGSAVRYDCLAEDAETLDAYVDALAVAELGAMSRDERLATWINAYNAFTLRLILDYRPGIGSIKEIPRGRRWKDERWVVGGRALSLDAIEHEILRPDFDEPRIHFAINCASVSCPDLRAEAYVAARLDEQLDDATRRFLRDPDKGARTGDEKGLLFGVHRALRVSSLFDWFEEDFTAGGDTVVDYVLPYLGDKDRRYVERHRDDLALRFLSYDWSLNDR